MHNDLARNSSVSAVIGLPRAMDVTRSYWFAMLAASAFGTNVGDLWAEVLFPGRVRIRYGAYVRMIAAVGCWGAEIPRLKNHFRLNVQYIADGWVVSLSADGAQSKRIAAFQDALDAEGCLAAQMPIMQSFWRSGVVSVPTTGRWGSKLPDQRFGS
jgi:hypothetical protein